MKLLLRDPDLFFQNNGEKFRKDIVQATAFSALFSILTVISLEEGWTSIVLKTGLLETFTGIFGATILGIFIMSLFFMLFTFRSFGVQNFKKSFFVVAYSATPVLMAGWIPQGLIKLISIIWSFNFIWVGVKTVAKKGSGEAFAITILLAVILAVLSILTQVYLISPL